MPQQWNIKFYGARDMSVGLSLRAAETVFQHWDEYTHTTNINTILELFNIKKIFDIHARLDCWSVEQYEEYIEKCKTLPGVLGVDLRIQSVQTHYTDSH